MKILIRATNWVGDAVMCIPALAAVRARWPEAHIAILARPWVADIYAEQNLSNQLIHFDHKGRHAGIAGVERLARELRAEKFDTALLLQNAFEAAWIAWRAGIPERIGYARDGRGWLLTKAIPVLRHGEIPSHETHYYLELVRRANMAAESNKPPRSALEPSNVPEIRLRVSPEKVTTAESLLAQAEANILGSGPWPAGHSAPMFRVALAPGAAYGSAKCWPTDRYAALADRLISEFHASVILFGSPGEREVAERIAAQMRHRPVMLAGQTSIGDLPALLSRCRIFIGNDSGAMHVAAAVGLPVVAIFGPTDPFGTSPATEQLSLVQEKVSCSPCFLRHCPVDHRCMTRVSIDQVYAAVQTWIPQIAGRTAL